MNLVRVYIARSFTWRSRATRLCTLRPIQSCSAEAVKNTSFPVHELRARQPLEAPSWNFPWGGHHWPRAQHVNPNFLTNALFNKINGGPGSLCAEQTFHMSAMHSFVWGEYKFRHVLSGMNPMTNSRNCTVQQSLKNWRNQFVHGECYCRNFRHLSGCEHWTSFKITALTRLLIVIKQVGTSGGHAQSKDGKVICVPRFGTQCWVRDWQ